jgi:hypothetical protein
MEGCGPALTGSFNILLGELSWGGERCAQAGTPRVVAKDATHMDRIRDALCSLTDTTGHDTTRPFCPSRTPEASPSR